MNVGDGDLPDSYVQELSRLHLSAAWLALRDIAPPGQPLRRVKFTKWPFEALRSLLLQAGELVPIEHAERRVLGLQNPGIAGRLATTSSIFLGMQLILPGEKAPAHRHTPAAARLVMEGSDAFTVVNDEKLLMQPGDLLLTPPHHWHEHRHEGAEPMIWMDILDHPIAIPMEVSYLVERGSVSGQIAQSNLPDASTTTYIAPGLIPYRLPHLSAKRYPMMRFPWRRTREALTTTATYAARSDEIHFSYVNPETGGPLLETLGFSVRMLRPGEEVSWPARSSSLVLHILEGHGESLIDGIEGSWQYLDTLALPTFTFGKLRNSSSTVPAFLLQIDDAPMQIKLGYYEDEVTREERGFV